MNAQRLSIRRRILLVCNVTCNDGINRDLALVGGKFMLAVADEQRPTELCYRPIGYGANVFNPHGIGVDDSEVNRVRRHLEGIRYAVRLGHSWHANGITMRQAA